MKKKQGLSVFIRVHPWLEFVFLHGSQGLELL
jgi:hypothetical protein